MENISHRRFRFGQPRLLLLLLLLFALLPLHPLILCLQIPQVVLERGHLVVSAHPFGFRDVLADVVDLLHHRIVRARKVGLLTGGEDDAGAVVHGGC